MKRNAKLLRRTQRMLATVFADSEIVFERDRVVIRGVTFLFNNRAIESLNCQICWVGLGANCATSAHPPLNPVTYAENFSSLMAWKSFTSPPTRL